MLAIVLHRYPSRCAANLRSIRRLLSPRLPDSENYGRHTHLNQAVPVFPTYAIQLVRHFYPSFDAKLLEDGLVKKCMTISPRERVSLMLDADCMLNREAKLRIFEGILKTLCTSDTAVDWDIVKRVAASTGPLHILSINKSKVLLSFLEHALKGLVNDPEAGPTDVDSILRLIQYTEALSLTALRRLQDAHQVFVEVLPWMSTTRSSTRRILALICALGRSAQSTDFINCDFVNVCYDTVGPRLYSYSTPEANRKRNLMYQLAESAENLNVYHEGFLTSYAAYIQRVVESMKLSGVMDGKCLSLFSYMNFPAHELLESTRTVLDVPGRQWGDVSGVRSYIRLNWAFVAQGIEPPNSTMATMWEKLAAIMELPHASFNMPYWLLMMMEQLLAYAPPSLQAPQFVMKSLAQLDGFRLAFDVQSHIPSLGMFFLSPAGVIWICGIFDADTGFIVPWPADIRPEVVTTDTPLPGVPVALLFSSSDKTDMLYGSSKRNGVVERKHSMLCELGWRVAYVSISIHSKFSPVENVPAFCLDEMRKVAMHSVSSTNDCGHV